MMVAGLSLLAVLAGALPANPKYFTHVSDITITNSAPQQYVSVGSDIWLASKNSLGDLRLFDPQGNEIPYTIVVRFGGSRRGYTPATILNLGSEGRQTAFLVASPVAEYNRVKIEIRKKDKDFVTKVSVQGADTNSARRWRILGDYTLYDFSREDLGTNFELKLPLTRFQYLRMKVASGIVPKDVLEVAIANVQEEKANWLETQVNSTMASQGRTTVVTWEQDAKIPLENVHFQMQPGDSENFRRPVTLYDDKKKLLASGEIARVHLVRQGRRIDTENLDLPVRIKNQSKFQLVIENGDDQPVKISAVRPQFAERRVYFDSRGHTALKLYVGDEKLSSPTYDYAKLFAEEEVSTMAQLKPASANPDFTQRPDPRPWSDRHPSLLWIAMIAAVAVLGLLALRSFRHPLPIKK